MKNLYLILILLIVMFGTLVRNYNIENKGLFFYDEGVYLCAAKAKYLNFAEKLKFAPKVAEKDLVLKRHIAAKCVNFGTGSKIGFVFFIFLSQLIFGISAYSSFMVSVFFGSLTVLIVYLIARRMYDEGTALLSALILAVSPMHIMYSRCGLPLAASVFFLFLAFYFYVISVNNKKYAYMIVSALCAGAAFTIHYNLLLMLPLFFAFEALRLCFINKEEGGKFLKLTAFISALVLPVVFWQIITLSDKMFNFGFFPATYFAELKGSFSAIAAQAGSKIDPFFFFYFFQKMEGWIIFLLFFFGIFVLIKKLKRNFNMPEFILIILALFPIIWYGFYPHLRVLRSFTPALPAIAIMASFVVMSIARSRRMKFFGKILAGLLIIFILILGILGFKPILQLQSSYSGVVKYLYENNAGAKGPSPLLISYADEMYPVFNYYMGDDVIAINKFNDVGTGHCPVPTLINIFAFNKELENVIPYKVFKQVSFSAHNAEGGSKDKYKTKDIPIQEIRLYKLNQIRGLIPQKL